VALAAALGAWALLVAAPNGGAPGYDLAPVVVGAKVAAGGDFSSLYEHDPRLFNEANSPAMRRAAAELGFRRTPTPFVYPPLVAVLARPLVRFSFPVVVAGWLWIGAIATCVGVAIGARYFAPSFRRPAAWAVVVVALGLFEPIRYGLWLGQTTPVTFLLVMLSLWLAERGRPVAAGLALSLPAFVKLTPLLFALAWAWRRDQRALVSLAGALACWSILSIAVCGVGPNLEYLGRLREIGATTVVAYNNHSLAALLSRPVQPAAEIYRWLMVTPPLPVQAAIGIAAAVMLLVTWLALRPLASAPRTRAACGALAALGLLIPGIAWTHYFVLLVPVGIHLWEEAREVRGTAFYRVALAAALLLCSRPILPDQVDPRRGPGLLLGGPTLAALIIWALIVLLAWIKARGPRSPRPPSGSRPPPRRATARTR
jgi:hypothetical protein